jgi:hypothetical protein
MNSRHDDFKAIDLFEQAEPSVIMVERGAVGPRGEISPRRAAGSPWPHYQLSAFGRS